MKRPPFIRSLLLVVIFCLTYGCTALPQRPPSTGVALTGHPATVLQGDGWWRIRFKMNRNDDVTHWERDLLIAHRIVAPQISAHNDEIDLWRFHRRSANDDTGHQFSLLYYASAQTADMINHAVITDPLVVQLLATGILTDVFTDDVDHNDSPAVSDTSDKNWSPVMQRTWPYYIMGVSQLWLAMIDELSQEIGVSDNPDTSQLLDHYQMVNERLTYIWQHESQHALLHHLNAIFGYKAMIMRETRWQSF